MAIQYGNVRLVVPGQALNTVSHLECTVTLADALVAPITLGTVLLRSGANGLNVTKITSAFRLMLDELEDKHSGIRALVQSVKLVGGAFVVHIGFMSSTANDVITDLSIFSTITTSGNVYVAGPSILDLATADQVTAAALDDYVADDFAAIRAARIATATGSGFIDDSSIVITANSALRVQSSPTLATLASDMAYNNKLMKITIGGIETKVAKNTTDIVAIQDLLGPFETGSGETLVKYNGYRVFREGLEKRVSLINERLDAVETAADNADSSASTAKILGWVGLSALAITTFLYRPKTVW